jgi:hypothetical protein
MMRVIVVIRTTEFDSATEIRIAETERETDVLRLSNSGSKGNQQAGHNEYAFHGGKPP